jgi:hypothetical protein
VKNIIGYFVDGGEYTPSRTAREYATHYRAKEVDEVINELTDRLAQVEK